MTDALVGHTGFVGSNLLRRREFTACFNSKNSEQLAGQTFDRIWFSGLPGAKWAINRDPTQDQRNIERLQAILESVRCGQFVLISTIDVLGDHGAYGLHRREFEKWIEGQFANRLIVRLPGIFGVGLKKNVLFDLLNDHMLDRIHPEDAYQWYDLADLADDIGAGLEAGVDELDLYTAPIENREIFRFFPGFVPTAQARPPRRYDHRSRQAHVFGRTDYVRGPDEVLEKIGRFVDSTRAGPGRA